MWPHGRENEKMSIGGARDCFCFYYFQCTEILIENTIILLDARVENINKEPRCSYILYMEERLGNHNARVKNKRDPGIQLSSPGPSLLITTVRLPSNTIR